MAKKKEEETEKKSGNSAETAEKSQEIDSKTETLEEGEESEEKEIDGDSSDEDEETNKLQDELSDMKDKYVRLYSEFDNFRRRVAKEKLEIIGSASSELITDLLPTLDDFGRALNTDSEKADPKSLLEGMTLIHDKFKKTLIKKGLKEMELKEGSDFDPEFHEAISQIPVEKKKLKGKIIDVVEKGYTLNDKVIRYAKVVVGN